jgi:hypothetical protein
MIGSQAPAAPLPQGHRGSPQGRRGSLSDAADCQVADALAQVEPEPTSSCSSGRPRPNRRYACAPRCQQRVSSSRRNVSILVARSSRNTPTEASLGDLVDLRPLTRQVRQAGGHWFEPSTAHLISEPKVLLIGGLWLFLVGVRHPAKTAKSARFAVRLPHTSAPLRPRGASAACQRAAHPSPLAFEIQRANDVLRRASGTSSRPCAC